MATPKDAPQGPEKLREELGGGDENRTPGDFGKGSYEESLKGHKDSRDPGRVPAQPA